MSTIFFNSHRSTAYKTESWRHIFSQWYNSGQPFIGKPRNEIPHDLSEYLTDADWNNHITNKQFSLREQFMMYMKAIIFAKNDNKYENLKIAEYILNTNDPKTIKDYGRKVLGYDETIWNACRFKVVVNGNYLEFTQNKEMLKILLNTNNRELVEASPKDRIWGIGFNVGDGPKTSRDKWGQNLLGKSIMETRTIIQSLPT